MLKRRDGRWSSPLTYAAISRKNEDFEICLMTRRFTFFFFWGRSLSKTITISEEFQVLYAHYEKRGTFAASSYATSLSNWEKNDVVVLLLKLMMVEHEPPDLPHHGFGTSLPMLVWGQKEACFWICQISSKNEVIFHLYVRRSK